MFHIRKVKVSEIYSTPWLKKRLKMLTNGGWGRKTSTMACYLEYEMLNDVYIAYDQKGEPVGWCSRTYDGSKRHHCNVDVYVAPRFRGQGIGQKLVKRMKWYINKYDKKAKIHTIPYTAQGAHIYEKFGI